MVMAAHKEASLAAVALFAVLLLLAAADAGNTLKWSAELKHLRCDALAKDEVQHLASDHAAQVASALRLRPEDISDALGRPGLVTLAAPATASTTEAPAEASDDFSRRLAEVTMEDLGSNSSAIQGSVQIVAPGSAIHPEPAQSAGFGRQFPLWCWALAGLLTGLLLFGALGWPVVSLLAKRRAMRWATSGSNEQVEAAVGEQQV
mmetsp:Transcript_40819/g.131302  ORF Transcript_40819/g.131302 Transcript_40819/m.131302 type:complete len:205 (+) Transcript_40819:200-814(+)